MNRLDPKIKISSSSFLRLPLLPLLALALVVSGSQARAQTVLIDFGGTLTTNASNYWNNYTSNTFLGLSNSQGGSTAYFFTPNVGGLFNTNFITGSPNLTNLGAFNVSTVYSDAMYTTGTNSYYFYNVNTNLTYDFTLLGSRDSASTRTTLYNIAGSNSASGSVTTSGSNIGGTGTNYNTSTLVTLTGLRSTNYGGGIGNGFLLTVTAQSGGFGYLNAMQAYGYLGYLGGGTFDLNTNAPYVQVATNTDGAVSADTVIGGGSTVNVGSASGIYYNSTLVMTNGGGTINRNTNFTIYSLAGAGNLALGGTEGMTISRAGTYSGTLTINGGTLTLNASNAIASGNMVLNGGTLTVNAAQGLGTGTITVASGTTTLNNSSALTALTGNNAFVLQGGTFTVNGGGKVLNLGTGSVANSGTSGLNAYNGGMQFDGVISGSGTINWFGGGSLVLGAANTFSGTINAAVNGGSLVLSNANALQNATLNKGTNHNVVFALAGSNTYNLGGLTGAGNIALTNGNSLNVNAAASSTYSGALSDSGSLTKSGSGTLTLSGANTHSGGTTLSAGQLNINNASALGAGTFTVANGTTFDNTSGAALTNTQNNAIVLGATNTFAGTKNLHLGNGNVTISGNTRLHVSGNNLTLGGNITGSAAFNKDGIGSLTLAGSNAMTSFIVVDYGILNLAHTAALANAQLYLYGSGSNKMVTFGAAGTNTYNLGALSGAGTGVLTLGANSVNVGGNNATTTYSGTISGSGSVTKSGTGTFTLAGANTHSGGTILTSGQINIENSSALGTGAFTASNGTSFDNTSGGAMSNANNNALTLGGTNTFVGSAALNFGSGNVTLASATRLKVSGSSLTLSGGISGSDSLNKDGIGTLTLAASNAMTSFIVVDYGILNLAHTAALANAQLYLYGSGSNKMVTFGAAGNNTYSLGALSGASDGSLGLGSNSINVGAANVATTYAGTITGTGGLTKSGNSTLTLSGANTYSGATTISGGTLDLGNTTGAALGSTASVSVASGATLLISQNNQVNNSASVSLSGGTIRAAAGISEAFGNLSVTSASFLDFGTTSYANANTIAFGNYTSSALLTINNFNFGSTMTFGRQLDSTDLATFSFTNGGIASTNWDTGTSTFTITAIPESSTIVAAFGLLALFIWPARRIFTR